MEDRWILSLLNRTIQEVNKHLTDYAFDRAATTAYDFFWKEFCAYYVELVKPVLFGKTGTPEEKETKQKILSIVLCHTVRLMHPMAPFITEELFQMLKTKLSSPNTPSNTDPYTAETLKALSAPACIVSIYPQVIRSQDINPEIEKTFSFVDQIIYAIRNIRAEMQLPPNISTDLFIHTSKNNPERQIVEQNLPIIKALVRLNTVTVSETEQTHLLSASAIVSNLKLVIPLPQELREKEKLRLHKEQEKLTAQQNGMRQQLANADFVAKAPQQLVEKLKANLSQSEKELAEVMKKISDLQS